MARWPLMRLLLEYFPIPSTDWVSQINVNAWFDLRLSQIITIRNMKIN